jgi:hypothetical protein
MLAYINTSRLLDRVDQDALEFANAVPFKHIVLDDLLVPGCESQMSDAFPDKDWQGWENADHQYQRFKSSCSSVEAMPPPIDRAVLELLSGELLNWLEKLTGIQNLLVDPHLGGGGLHTTFEGGYLVPHTDFHITNVENYYRRLNLLLYLNPTWQSENGGSLELWDKRRDAVAKEVLPVIGRCVVFQTDDESVHGFSKPVSGRIQRNSIALYYYTSTPPEQFSGDGNTYWHLDTLRGKERQTSTSILKRRLFLGIARLASRVSWRAGRMASQISKEVEGKSKRG